MTSLLGGLVWGAGKALGYKYDIPLEAFDLAVNSVGYSALGLFGATVFLSPFKPSLGKLRTIDSKLDNLEIQKLLLESNAPMAEVDLGPLPPPHPSTL